MTKQTWRALLAVGCGFFCLMATGGSVRAQGMTPPGMIVDDDCDDCDDGCEPRRCRFSLCNKFRLHCAYNKLKCSRPYIQLQETPPELAPYVGSGSYHSPGYGLPYQPPAAGPYGAMQAPMGRGVQYGSGYSYNPYAAYSNGHQAYPMTPSHRISTISPSVMPARYTR
ncbi:MAG: hypothetical protein ACKV0T_26860 [Planctomycetales bacterium]